MTFYDQCIQCQLHNCFPKWSYVLMDYFHGGWWWSLGVKNDYYNEFVHRKKLLSPQALLNRKWLFVLNDHPSFCKSIFATNSRPSGKWNSFHQLLLFLINTLIFLYEVPLHKFEQLNDNKISTEKHDEHTAMEYLQPRASLLLCPGKWERSRHDLWTHLCCLKKKKKDWFWVSVRL